MISEECLRSGGASNEKEVDSTPVEWPPDIPAKPGGEIFRLVFQGVELAVVPYHMAGPRDLFRDRHLARRIFPASPASTPLAARRACWMSGEQATVMVMSK